MSQLGLQASWDRYIQVDGQLYLKGMPEYLVTATWDHANKRITDAQLHGRIEERERYRLKPKQRMDKDGYQRFSLPDPNSYDELADPKTGELMDKPSFKSVTIPPQAGLKFRQLHPFESKEWTRWYGMRSLVEHSNGFVKDGAHEALDDPQRRTGKGWAYQYLMFTIAVVSSNVRKISRSSATSNVPASAPPTCATNRSASAPTTASTAWMSRTRPPTSAPPVTRSGRRTSLPRTTSRTHKARPFGVPENRPRPSRTSCSARIGVIEATKARRGAN
jgi:hypothetical protein